MKVINGTNIRDDGRFDPSNTTRAISLVEFESKYRHFAIDANDIVVASSGTLGKAALVKPEHLPMMMNTSVVRFRSKDRLRLDDGFLFAWLRSRDFLDQALGMATGAAQQNFGPSHIKQMTLPLPAIVEQRRIASILSAYDDLIENNTRRIAILEEMARRIYEEWFVRFRFPGFEAVQMVASELGLVPDGWRVVRLDEVLVLQRGFDLPKQDRTDGPFPIISATGATATHHEHRVKGPGVVTGRSGSLGTVMYVEGDFWPLNTTLWVKEFVVGSALYAFYVLQSIDLAGFNSGAAVPTLNRNDVHGLPVLRPTFDVLARFDEVAGPTVGLKRRLEMKNTNLRTTRDLLLPKLISGELDVSALPEPKALTA